MTVMTAPATLSVVATSTKHVSRNCASGKHTRCLGTVYVFPIVDGKRLVDCECPVKDCGHGSEHEKAKRKSG